MTNLRLREEPRSADLVAVRRLTVASGGFSAAEIDIAVELVEERLRRGLEASGYHFLFADEGDGAGSLLGYVCFGPIPLTAASWDLYWIAVAGQAQGRGIGRRLLDACEARSAAAGARMLYADTSGRPDYARTRGFYLSAGFSPAAELADFYAPGDAKIVFAKRLAQP